jgi:signal transduction histidine kinase
MQTSKNNILPIEHYPFPAVLIDYVGMECKVLRANESFNHLYGLSSTEARGQDLFGLDLFTIEVNGKAFSGKIQKAIERAADTSKPKKVFYSNPPKNKSGGNRKTNVWLMEVAPLSTNGEQQVLLLTVHDLSGLREEPALLSQLWLEKEHTATNQALEKEIAEAGAQYKALTQELNNFMYSVSHDLRAPLRRIDGFSQELINEYAEELDETGAHYLSRIRQGAQDMGVLIDELLKLSRLSRRKVNRQQVHIGPIARKVFEELHEPDNGRDITFHIPKELETYADPGLVKVLLINLLSNAIKFTSKEEQAEIELGQTEENGEEVFYLQDNGAGFDPAHADQLFKAFSRLHSQKAYPGSGIGLATVQRIISLHGGHIWGESQEGEGATFYFNFE